MNHPLLIKKTIRELLLCGAVWAGIGKVATGLLSLGISALWARKLSSYATVSRAVKEEVKMSNVMPGPEICSGKVTCSVVCRV